MNSNSKINPLNSELFPAQGNYYQYVHLYVSREKQFLYIQINSPYTHTHDRAHAHTLIHTDVF